MLSFRKEQPGEELLYFLKEKTLIIKVFGV